MSDETVLEPSLTGQDSGSVADVQELPAQQVFDMPPAGVGFAARGAWLLRSLMRDLSPLTLPQAGGIVGNIGFESGGLVKLQEISPTSGRGGYGWPQWTASRRVAFEHWCADHDVDVSSDFANYNYLLVELRSNEAKALDQLRKTTTLEAAVFTFGYFFERPGGTTSSFLPGNDQRIAWAEKALNELESQQQDLAEPVLTIPQRPQAPMRPTRPVRPPQSQPRPQPTAEKVRPTFPPPVPTELRQSDFQVITPTSITSTIPPVGSAGIAGGVSIFSYGIVYWITWLFSLSGHEVPVEGQKWLFLMLMSGLTWLVHSQVSQAIHNRIIRDLQT